MSNIIWKEKNSDSIQGLLICKLPSISKPKLRVETITIDGKDGEIINELGYESYDKEIEIGLTRNFDLNEMINYFNGDGRLILSNESDKYYIAKIIEKIDYDALLNFKTAKVKYRCQPYKYQLNEFVIEEEITTQESILVTNEGYLQSKPLITIKGIGSVGIYVNDIQIFTYNFGDTTSEVIIDSENQEAYFENELKNRNMLGEFPILQSGVNKISWIGNLQKITIEPKSRWL